MDLAGAEFEIEGIDNQEQTASNGRVAFSLIPGPDEASKMRKRNAIKKAGSPNAYKAQWLYAELDGVRCYVKDEGGLISVVMTKQDLYP